jgi:hypothetical protein
LLDANGILRGDRVENAPAADRAFRVFSQRADARIDVVEWRGHAERTLDVRLGLTIDKRYPSPPPREDAARVVVAPLPTAVRPVRGAAGTRACWGRPCTPPDVSAAHDAGVAGAGLADLAARCPTIWLVEIDGDDDPVALRIAAIFAFVTLGPILSPDGARLFGPRTARERLAAEG